jgi:hypothetical protein
MGNSHGLDRRMVSDVKMKKRLKTPLQLTHSKGKLSKAELRNIVDDDSL